jgi:hypothetical protein
MAEVEILGLAQGLSFNKVDRFIYEGEDRYTETITENHKTIAIGQCYPHAIKLAKETTDEEFNDLTKFKVIHGRTTNKWTGESVEHAWVEKGNTAFDWQTHATKPEGIPIDVYYDTYQPESYDEYTAEEAMHNCLKARSPGPWRHS